MEFSKTSNKVNFWGSYILHRVSLFEAIGNNRDYLDFGNMVLLGGSELIRNFNQKSHENLGFFPFLKKSVAFFQANPWLENSYKMEDLEI
ncbi:MAG: hypothetical protein ACOC1P_00795 [Minisyncoccales bacterium]